MSRLEDKVAVVTGGGQGIGRAISLRLAQEGATVAVNDIESEHAHETVELVESNGGEAISVIADVTDLNEMRRLVDEVVDELGPFNVFINNAGWDRIEWFIDQDPDIWDRIIDINYRGQVNGCRAAGEYFIDNEIQGTFVNIASDAGRVGSSGEAVYAGAKGGVIALTKTLAREFAHYGINCNVVAPGPTKTPLAERQTDTELGEKIMGSMADQVPLGRMGEPEDIAAAVAFFASDDASFITGQVLSVSGGLTMV